MKSLQKYITLGPPAIWLGIFFVAPLLIIFVYSFFERGIYGDIVYTFSLDNYLRAIDPLYAKTLWRSTWISVVSTLICLVLGYPLAWYIARQSAKMKKLLLVLLIVPFWTNFLVRTYAWIFILRTEGLLNNTLLSLGLISSPLEILFTQTAVIIGLVYTYLPFMVLPIYVSIEKLDRALFDACRDLGATSWQSFKSIMLPLTKPGIISGCILVFVPCLGAYITPDLLGGAKSLMVGNLIQVQFLAARDWPFGAALSFIVMAIVLLLLFAYARWGTNNFDKAAEAK
ncbi:MAG: ABC transporter permease [Bacteroidetes bacterium]|nr:ABC transporter permease [Bacteroidota bacterium]MCH8523781.1 ABC transporter permease [Balneolales bacterium]